MKINIRKGVFETNSSSCHSISLGGNDFHMPNIHENCINIECDEFGWETEKFNDFYTKLSYLLTYIFSTSTLDSFEKLIPFIEHDNTLNIEAFFEKYPDKSDLFEKVTEVIDETIGEQIKLKVRVKDNFNPFGYIDHQSIDIAHDILRNKKDIKKFLFYKDSILYTDNDNY